MEPGVYYGLPNEKYHAGPGLSVSGVKTLHRSPFHFARTRAPGAPRKAPTAAMLNGTLVHCALLEPGEFDRRYVVAPNVSKAAKVYKDFADYWQTLGMQAISAEQRAAAFDQAAALRGLDEVGTLLSDGRAEVSAYWRDEHTGVLCKCRPDFVAEVAYGTGVVLLDVKTAANASPEEFARACGRYGYHLQADWYSTGYARASGLTVHGMLFAVVENEYPYAAASYMLGDASLLEANRKNREALVRYAACEAANDWPGYPRGFQVIDVPAYF